jgi:group I intron endonuclease|nr:MAG TPA_asm: intron associated endonuclease [Caudoviricetes sp.]
MACGIYGIHNLISDKWYVGQAIDIRARWNAHRSNLKLKRNEPLHLISAWHKYGPSAFEWLILEECPEEQLDEREMYWIEQKGSFRSGYNQTLGGYGSTGHHQSPETLKLRSAAMKLAASDPDYRANRSKLSKEMWQDPAYRQKVVAIRQKAMDTPEYKQKISAVSKTRYQNPEYLENYRRKLKAYYADPNNRSKILAAAQQRGSDKKRNKKIGAFHKKRYAENAALREKVSWEAASRWADPEIRAKMVRAQTESAQKRATPVLQMETGIVFPSMRAAADSIGGKATPASICAVCKGLRKTCYGFHWQYADENLGSAKA